MHYWQLVTDNPNLILLFQHFESFDPILLSDTIYLLSSLAIPITLIFHVATSLDAIKSLPFSARSLLRLQTFQLDRGLETLTDLLWGLYMDRTLPLAIGGEALKSLKSGFVERERSIDLVVDKLHVSRLSFLYASGLMRNSTSTWTTSCLSHLPSLKLPQNN